MPDDARLPTDAKLSEADVKRVLERAVQIDGTQTAVTVSDLTQAAHEAGISETAMLQAVQELLQDREMAVPADPGSAPSAETWVGSVFRPRTVAFAFSLVIALLAIYYVVQRLFP